MDPAFGAYRLAGLAARVAVPPGIVLPDPGPLYAPFALDGAGETDLLVTVEPGPPESSPGPGLFPGGVSWSFTRQAQGFSLAFQPPGEDRPLWEARADRDFSRVLFRTPPPAPGRPLPFHPLGYPLGQILVLHALALRNGALIHAAGLAANGRAFLFPGRSGAGKTTLTRLVLNRPGLSPFTDDRAAVREENGRFTALGTPWAGEAAVGENVSAPLAGLLFLAHAPETRATPLTPGGALERLLPTASLPWYDRELLDPALALCGRLCETVPAWEFAFSPDAGALDALERLVEGIASF